MSEEFQGFLTEQCELSRESIDLAARSAARSPHQLSLVLWQYGLISLEQLDQIWEWLAGQPVLAN
ncbi:MAG: DUF2949 domain-containing protein [Cyanobacteria bacterium P01_H01_bin.15]